ncbi:MAG: hypothetical protein AB7P02_14985 [Alphaproteobacteria bacterium]
MNLAIGLALLAVYIATTPVLWRALRAGPRPVWLRRSELNREVVMVAHMLTLIVAAGLLVDWVAG